MKPIWIVDDDQSIRFVLEKALLREGLPTRSFINPREVIKALDGKAYVDAWVNPYNQSEHLNTKILPEVLAKGPYDVIHFNMGLHGWQEGRIKPGTRYPATLVTTGDHDVTSTATTTAAATGVPAAPVRPSGCSGASTTTLCPSVMQP